MGQRGRLGPTGGRHVHTCQKDHTVTSGAGEAAAYRRALFVQIQSFVWQHLGDPGLCPDAIAAAHHISTRSLHRLFQSRGCTVSAWVRRQRLGRARRDLADPRLAGRTIQSIAATWGFPRPADFTRAFRAAYGVPPQDFRAGALRGSWAGRPGNPAAPERQPVPSGGCGTGDAGHPNGQPQGERVRRALA
ncbi:helix-turn-helix domain-containing protein [Streptomyces diacarni]|uniref:Helix-turn-helix domain-containing protein n=1 Tax=Streptomyces diacarni TaxID=2800381 RepID=A0A367EB66_9ACTN|nr:helix-turn-helix domain-containing protein [Streptomyces diacarni]